MRVSHNEVNQNEKHVENVIKVAKSLETATGLPLQKLKNDIIDITSDIDRFGDINFCHLLIPLQHLQNNQEPLLGRN